MAGLDCVEPCSSGRTPNHRLSLGASTSHSCSMEGILVGSFVHVLAPHRGTRSPTSHLPRLYPTDKKSVQLRNLGFSQERETHDGRPNGPHPLNPRKIKGVH